MELMLAVAYRQKGDAVREQFYIQTAEARRRAINRYCWSPEARWFMDYDLSEKRQSPSLTLAGMFPFFFKVADKGQFAPARRVLEERFLKPGGVVTTVTHTSEQWDSPNGWAPLQWITIRGLEQYGDRELASRIAKRWIALNKRVYESTGKLMEKYDVVEANKTGGGGEYPAQDGFGWTNGVLIALIQKYGLTK
jgi:alpha,alpha-trehalase